MYLCGKFRTMRARVIILSIFIFTLHCFGEVHIHIDNPETWTTGELAGYIGQTVVFDAPIVVSSNAGSTLTVSPRRLFTPTNQAYPRSAAYNSVASLNSSGAMSLSGVYEYHRCGEKIYNLTARVNGTNSLTWVSGEWRGNTREELEAGIPDVGDYRLLVCTMNLEYYLAAGTGSGSMGPSSYEEHQHQRTKIRKALTRINADLYGFVEIESGDDALKEIANDLNDNLSGRNFTIISDGTSPNGTYTKAGFVYDANKLTPIGKLQEINAKVSNRKKMICFEEKETGERFIFSVNHFKAKSGSGSGGDANQGDGQGTFNATRVEEAQAVIDHYKKYRQALGEQDILIMGDLNAYAKEDPVTRLTSNGMLDLHRAFHADSSYSYQFGGLAGYLDHALSNGSLYPQVTGVSGFHINSDENDRYTYDKSDDYTMFRCSDHDPVIVGLRLDGTKVYDPSPAINSAEIISGEAGVMTITNAISETPSYYAIYDMSGVLIEQKEIVSTMQEVELPGKAGVYIVYIYFDGQVYQRKMIVR